MIRLKLVTQIRDKQPSDQHEYVRRSRKPHLLVQVRTGNFFIDDELLRERGITDFSVYAHDASRPGSIGHGPEDLELDLFLDE